jgi:hypothetical protein
MLPILVGPALARADFLPTPGAESETPVARASLLAPRSNEAARVRKSAELAEKIRHRLVGAGWKASTAEAIIKLNAEWFLLMDQENRAELNHQLTALAELGKHQEELADFLEDHPETAGLLAGVSDPTRVAKTLRAAGNAYPLLAGLYFRYATGSDILDLTEALEQNRDRIVGLTRRGLIGSEAIFVLPRKTPGDRAYELWVQEQVDAKLGRSDEELASLLQLVLNQGLKVCARLQQDDHFRAAFRSILWPRLARAAASQGDMFEAFLDEPLLWDFLALPDAEKLLTDWGKLPIPLLVGARAYPKDQHGQIVQAFLNDDKLTIETLVEYLDQPLFRKLQARPLDEATRKAAFHRLLTARPNHPLVLLKLDRLTDRALKEEVGPPPEGVMTWAPGYAIYLVCKKLYQDRDVTSADWFEAGLDALSFIPAVKGAVVAKKGGATAIRAGGKVFTTGVRNTGTRLAAKKLGQEVAAKLAEKGLEGELVKWSITGTMARMQRTWTTATHKLMTFDVTKPVRFIYSYGGFNRETFRRLSGLEARLFMRKDAQVFLHIGNVRNTMLGNAAKRYLNEYAEYHAKRFLGDTFDDPAGGTPRASPPSLTAAVLAELNDAWRRHAAAWWLRQLGRPN